MNAFQVFASISLTVGCVSAFNIDTSLPIIRTVSNGGESYFGYSVVIDGMGKWIYVGAPKANDSNTNVVTPGRVYRCPIGNRRDEECQPLELDPANIVSDSWIGGSLSISSKKGVLPRRLSVCGPKWFRDVPILSGDFRLMNGICFILRSTDNINEFVPPNVTPSLSTGFYLESKQLGFSAQFAEHGESILYGAPGYRLRTGALARTAILDRRSSLQPQIMYLKTVTATSVIDDYGAYSVSSGNIRNQDMVDYVYGSPRESHLRGKVVVVDQFLPDSAARSAFEARGSQMGEYFGSAICVLDVNGDGWDDLLVGAPLYTPDLNSGDSGRVAVFINNRGLLSQGTADNNIRISIYGLRRANARFGSAIASAGDINRDGYNDFVVSAPYEEHPRSSCKGSTGAIYLFLGSRGRTRNTISQWRFSQRIHACDVDRNIRSFGMSLHADEDIDSNNYGDVAVGAYESGHAVVLRARPVVTFTSKLNIQVVALRHNDTHFPITFSVGFNGTDVPDTLEIDVNITVDSRGYFEETQNTLRSLKNVNISKDEIWNRNSSTVMLRINNRDYFRSFTVRMTYALSHHEDSDSIYPIADPNQIFSREDSVVYATGCINSGVCTPDLSVSWEFRDYGGDYKYHIGSNKVVILDITVRNHGENAYAATLTIRFPEDSLEVVHNPRECRIIENSRNLTCDVGNPLSRDNTVGTALQLEFTLGNVASDDHSLNITLNATSVSQDANIMDNEAIAVLPLVSVVNVPINELPHGNASFTISKESKAEHSLLQEYAIQQLAVSPIEEVKVSFLFPRVFRKSREEHIFAILSNPRIFIQDEEIRPNCNGVNDTTPGRKRLVQSNLDILSDDSLPNANITAFANCSRSNIDCILIECSVTNISPQRLVRFLFNVTLKSSESALLLSDKDSILRYSSSASVEIVKPRSYEDASNSKTMKTARTSTVIFRTPVPEAVEWWIYVSSGIGGALILALITMGFVKAGFFKRPEKEQLKARKRETMVGTQDSF